MSGFGRTVGWALIAAIFGGAGGGAVALKFLAEGDRSSERLNEVIERQDAFEQQIAQMRMTLKQMDLSEAVTSLEGRIEKVDGLGAKAADLEALEVEVARLEETYRAEIASLRGARAKAAAAALAVREIQSAIEQGSPFTAALAELAGIMEDDTVIVELARGLKSLDDGVATLSELGKELDTVRVEYLQAHGEGTGSWVNRTVENLKALIDVEGVPQLQGVDGILRDARDKTILDQLPAALAEVEPIVGDVEGLPDWIERARARLSASELLGEIDRHLDERISRQG